MSHGNGLSKRQSLRERQANKKMVRPVPSLHERSRRKGGREDSKGCYRSEVRTSQVSGGRKASGNHSGGEWQNRNRSNHSQSGRLGDIRLVRQREIPPDSTRAMASRDAGENGT